MILITGGAGYIGSHCVLHFLQNGYDCVIFDNLSNSSIETVKTLQKYGNLEFFQGDLRNPDDLEKCFKTYGKAEGILHFAGKIIVSESVENPYDYYDNNVTGTLNLYQSAQKSGIKNIILSSSCAVYGEPKYTPIDENHPLNPINPYGQTKLTAEKISEAFDTAFGIKTIKLRYFNVAGCKGFLGENHNPETHLIPNIIKAILSDREINIYGNTYNTPDGTCIRDYVNVNDLADAHLKAFIYLKENNISDIFNVGTEKGNSVNEIIDLLEEISDKKINRKILPKRDGDSAILLANSSKAKQKIGFENKHTLRQSLMSAYEYEKQKRKVLS